MNVGEIVKKKGHEVITISIEASFDQARKLMNDKHIGALMVLDKNSAVAGIVTERDLLSKMEEKEVKKMMTPMANLATLKPAEPLQKAMKIFTEKKIRHLPVMEDGKLLGMLSIGDAVKNLLDAVELENKYLKEYIMGQDY
jgi:CBS domain-containing protein